MNPAATAERLVAARRTGLKLARLESELLPGNDDDAYRVQEETLRLMAAPIRGWKVGGADPKVPPQAAPLMAPLVRPSPARFTVSAQSFRGVEAELALTLARDLPPRGKVYSDDEAWDAVASVHVAIELLDSRYADRRAMTAAALLADMQSNGGFTHGAPAAVSQVDFLTAKASLLIDGRQEKSAVGGNPAGHPKRLLGWLANHAAARGRPLKAGDIVTTGSHTGVTIAPVGARVVVRFEGLGEAEMALAGP